MGSRLRLLLVDDHALVRQSLGFMLRREKDFEIVGEAGDGANAIEEARRLKPDLILMDVQMPEMNGIEATERIAKGMSVLILSGYPDADEVVRAIEAGARGYVSKASGASTLFRAIRTVAAGGMQFDELVTPIVRDRLAAARKTDGGTGVNLVDLPAAGVPAAGTAPAPPGPAIEDRRDAPNAHGLTSRELEVLRCLADGKSNDEIGFELGITPGTVRSHIGRVFDKLGVKNRTEAATFAIRAHLFPF